MLIMVYSSFLSKVSSISTIIDHILITEIPPLNIYNIFSYFSLSLLFLQEISQHHHIYWVIQKNLIEFLLQGSLLFILSVYTYPKAMIKTITKNYISCSIGIFLMLSITWTCVRVCFIVWLIFTMLCVLFI